jgi:uncharacterized protein
MRCPVDNETLVMADRGGVEIDYCPKCRGVWLDRGELDKIIERSMGAAPAAAAVAPAPPQAPVHLQQPRTPERQDRGYDDRGRDRRDDDDYRDGYKRKKRESFLGELFDF